MCTDAADLMYNNKPRSPGASLTGDLTGNYAFATAQVCSQVALTSIPLNVYTEPSDLSSADWQAPAAGKHLHQQKCAHVLFLRMADWFCSHALGMQTRRQHL